MEGGCLTHSGYGFLVASHPLRALDNNRHGQQISQGKDRDPAVKVHAVELLEIREASFGVDVTEHESDVTDHGSVESGEIEADFSDSSQGTTKDDGEDGKPDEERVGLTEEAGEDDREDRFSCFDDMGEGDSNFGEGNTSRNVTNSMEESRDGKSGEEFLVYRRARHELEAP